MQALAILFGVVAAAAVCGLIVMVAQRRRQVAHARASALHQVIVGAHQLADAAMAIPNNNEPIAVTLWWRLVEAHDATLNAARSALTQLRAHDRLAPAFTDVSTAQEALRAAVATDRSVRVDAPAPTNEQLDYSAALVRERANALRESADALEALILPTAVH